MSIKIRHCIVIFCDVCNHEQEHEDFGTTHFASLDEAVKYLGSDGDDDAEWLMSPAEHVCPSCRAKRACATVGHRWDDEWNPVNARGIPMQWRWCWNCSEREYAPSGVTP